MNTDILIFCFSDARAENPYPLVDQCERAGALAELIHEIAQPVGVIQAGNAPEAEQIIDTVAIRVDRQKRAQRIHVERVIRYHSIFRCARRKSPPTG